jgi:tetratricopeptide (TPR) repeat protein
MGALGRVAFLGFFGLVLGCASASDGLPNDASAAWQAAFDAGSAAHAAGDREAAEVHLREALEIAQAEQPPGVRTGLALNGIAALLIDQGRFGEAEPTLVRAIALLESGGAAGSLHYAAALTNAGELALGQGRAADAERRFAQAAQVAEAQSGPAAATILQRSLSGQARALRREGRDAEAQALEPRLVQLCQAQPGPGCPAPIAR